MNRAAICNCIALLVALNSTVEAQDQPKNSSPQDAEAFQQRMSALIDSGTPADLMKFYSSFKERFKSNDKEAENRFKALKNQRAILMSHAEHSSDLLDLIDMAIRAKRDKNNVGYLYAMKVIIYFKQNDTSKAMSSFWMGLSKDPYENMAGDVIKFWPMVFKDGANQQEYVDVLAAIAISSWDVGTVESALKTRIRILGDLGRHMEALDDAKRLFNVSSIGRTAQAVLILDKELGFAKPEVQRLFRDEQTKGAESIQAAIKKSSVVLEIHVSNVKYEGAMKKLGGDSSIDASMHQVMALLVADEPSKALILAESCVKQATAAKDVEKANDLYACCLKALDGTVGRANEWLALRPSPAAVGKPDSSIP